MAATGLRHRPSAELRVGGGMTRFAENVAWGDGATWRDIHEGLMQSGGHRQNLLSRDYSRVGIAILVVGSEIWVAQNFGG